MFHDFVERGLGIADRVFRFKLSATRIRRRGKNTFFACVRPRLPPKAAVLQGTDSFAGEFSPDALFQSSPVQWRFGATSGGLSFNQQATIAGSLAAVVVLPEDATAGVAPGWHTGADAREAGVGSDLQNHVYIQNAKSADARTSVPIPTLRRQVMRRLRWWHRLRIRKRSGQNIYACFRCVVIALLFDPFSVINRILLLTW